MALWIWIVIAVVVIGIITIIWYRNKPKSNTASTAARTSVSGIVSTELPHPGLTASV